MSSAAPVPAHGQCPPPVFPKLLERALKQDLSRYKVVEVGWYDTEMHWRDLPKLAEEDLRAQAFSICR